MLSPRRAEAGYPFSLTPQNDENLTMLDFSDPFFSAPKEKKQKKRRGRRVYAAPERSARLYVYIDSSKVHMFRFFLEARDNLGIMTVVDRWRAVLLLRFSPHQEKEVREFLNAVKESLPITLAAVPSMAVAR